MISRQRIHIYLRRKNVMKDLEEMAFNNYKLYKKVPIGSPEELAKAIGSWLFLGR